MNMIELQLEGLHCQHCVKSIETALNALPTVTHVQIELSRQHALICSQERVQTLIETIENLGFNAKQV